MTIDVPHRAGLVAVSLASCAGVMVALGAVLQRSAGESLIPVLAATSSASIVVLAAWSLRHVVGAGLTQPVLVVAGFLGLVYVARPVFIYLTDTFGSPMVGFDALNNHVEQVVAAFAILNTAILAYMVAFIVGPRSTRLYAMIHGRHLRPHHRLVLIAAFATSALAAVYALRQIVAFPGGWQAALTVRADLYAGQTIIVWALEAYRFVFLAWLAVTLKSGPVRPGLILVVLTLWLPTMFFDALGGSRAELILRNLIPTVSAVAVAVGSRARGRVVVLALLPLAVLLFVGYRGIVRDPVAPSSVEGDARGFAYYLLAGDEAAAFDYFVLVREAVPSSIRGRGLHGAVAVGTALVPSALFPGKLPRASEELTSKLTPGLYSRGGNIAFSGASDLYYSFGDAAVVVGFAGLGVLSAVLLKGAYASSTPSEARRSAPWRCILGFTVAAALVSVFRADFHEFALLPLRVAGLIAALMLVSTEAGQPRRGAPTVAR